MSFVAEIISTASEAELIDLNKCISDLSKKMIKLKLDVKNFMEESYVKLLPFRNISWAVVESASELTQNIAETQSRLESQTGHETASEIKQLKDLRESLEEYISCIHIINRLIEIDAGIRSARSEQAAAKYFPAAELLLSAERQLVSPDMDGGENSLEWLDIYESLSSEITIWKDKFVLEASAHWQSVIEWNTIDVSDKSKIVSLQISNEMTLKENLLRTLDLYGLAYVKIRSFAETLMDDILYPVLTSECSVSRGPSSPLAKEKSTVLSVNINFQKKKSQFGEVYNNLINVFNFIWLMLNMEVSEGKTFFALTGECISHKFLKLLVSDCLHSTIPLSRDELMEYEHVIQKTKDLEQMLLDQGFLVGGSEILHEFYDNVVELYTNKKCKHYLEGATKCMKKDLHDMKAVGSMTVGHNASVPMVEEGTSTMTMTEVWTESSQFPYCQISKSVDDVLMIVNEALVESIQNDDKISFKLFDCAREIFILYIDSTPKFHKDLLDSIPQQSAILYNNMMYLAHKLITLEFKYKNEYPLTLAAHITSFLDLVGPLRSSASSIFDSQLQKQMTQIINIVQQSGLATVCDLEIFPKSIEKGVNQCLRLLILLQMVWQNVLPASRYSEVMGLLCNSFIEEIIQTVVAMKDIREDVATEMVGVFKRIQDKAPSVFQEPNEIHRHVKRWSRFNELIRVLSAHLFEIEERWADGKGPLALEFKPDQVRHLVKALFQASEKRAGVLSRIN